MDKRLRFALQAAGTVIAIGVIAIVPSVIELFGLMQLTLFAAMSVLALSLAFIWGYGGILSFGQTAFFGLGGYAYAIAAVNFQDSTPAILLAIVVPALFAAILGYFIFFGRISDVYLGVITLTVTLILFNSVNSTSGDAYKIGKALLGGFNGMPAVPTFNVPFDPSTVLSPEQSWWTTAYVLLGVFLLLRLLLALPAGRIIVAVRENEIRASLLGYDPRLVKCLTFILGGAIAGLAGALYVNWGAFVSPTIFSLSLSAEIIIWITVGGLGTLLGPIIGCVVIEYIVAYIGSQQLLNSNLVLGGVLVVFVLLLPKGIVPTARDLVMRLIPDRKPKTNGPPVPSAAAPHPAGAE
ncbi:Putative Branched-chain amino acid ABC transporter (permease protein) [Bradyrhizobium sp. ORS 285]|uniref:branched-chain amino acid ABC transporter permease n=1 Tax=Bradyrhizobium sp. ORS 285 TaxID=115808 RepID=UPI00024073B0|nr:branched-chain amino acid ABC transporter permease [Bradyrhizobium sp. ORS 285]CCD89034.1 putative Branched-chain amino acid ABC transporter (permease protein) [Bradyrhizobium sp. ORS 285]SMX58304.1 Putative Branched-chain amino acid ABC transporter (permease protein) [Bradyrhizobium sp. ORS 285]